MRSRWGPAARALAVATLLAALLGGGVARAQGLRIAAEPSFTHTETDVTDQAGTTSEQTIDLFTQSYRLSYDRQLTDRLAASAGGTFVDQKGWLDTNGVETEARGQTTGIFGRLSLGTPTLAAGIGADRREQRAFPSSQGRFITESYTGYASWRPDDLPEVELRLGHVNNFDVDRRAQDTSTNTAVFSTRYQGPEFDIRYLLSANDITDNLNRTETTSIEQTVLGSRTDKLFNNRTYLYLSGTLQARNVSTVAEGQGGVALRQQLPVAGLSAVEALPATSENIVLAPNPAVVDGNTGASAGINVGFAAGAVDLNLRDVGASFADQITEVNRIYVWLDRATLPEVGQALAASMAVYQSTNNLDWTPVAITAPPVVSPFENRVELSILQTAARYLKVVLRPLPPGVTTDVGFRDIFVTELQFYLAAAAELVPRHQDSLSGSATGTARTTILRDPSFAHDITVNVARHTESGLTTYFIVNGLSISDELWWRILGTARASRQDEDSGRGREGLWQWSASLVGRPLPTLHWTLAYNGTLSDPLPETSQEGAPQTRTFLSEPRLAHSVSFLSRADWYEGISTQVNASASIANQGERQTSTGQAGGNISLTPNTIVTLTAGGLYSRSVAFTPETGDIISDFARVDGTLALTPAPALSANATVTRVLLGTTPTTLATLQLNYFPLRGDLQLSTSYSKTLNTAAEATTEIFQPSLRWNIRRGVSLTSSYTYLQDVSPAQTLTSRAIGATLLLTL